MQILNVIKGDFSKLNYEVIQYPNGYYAYRYQEYKHNADSYVYSKDIMYHGDAVKAIQRVDRIRYHDSMDELIKYFYGSK